MVARPFDDNAYVKDVKKYVRLALTHKNPKYMHTLHRKWKALRGIPVPGEYPIAQAAVIALVNPQLEHLHRRATKVMRELGFVEWTYEEIDYTQPGTIELVRKEIQAGRDPRKLAPLKS